MADKKYVPSDGEWQIMEEVWNVKGGSMTSKEIVNIICSKRDISANTVRVMIKNLADKHFLIGERDAKDSRVFHYTPAISREECRRLKSRDFVKNYFKGNESDAIAALVNNSRLTDDQITQLQGMLDELKGKS